MHSLVIWVIITCTPALSVATVSIDGVRFRLQVLMLHHHNWDAWHPDVTNASCLATNPAPSLRPWIGICLFLRECYFTSDSVHQKVDFMRAVNRSTCSLTDREITMLLLIVFSLPEIGSNVRNKHTRIDGEEAEKGRFTAPLSSTTMAKVCQGYVPCNNKFY